MHATPSPIPHTVFDQPCLNFVNSEFMDHVGSGQRFDRLALPAWRRWFLARCGLPAEGSITDRELAALAALRRRMRRLLEGHAPPTPADIDGFNSILRAAPQTWRLSLNRGAGPPLTRRLLPDGAGWRAAVGIVVSSYAELVTSGELARVKRCGNEHCTFLFFDSTKSATRRWCDPHACGNLVKVRLYRSRRRGATGRAGSSRRTGRSGRSQTPRTRARRSG